MDTYNAETSLLGSLLLEDALIKTLEIDESYFNYERHQVIFKAMQQAYKEKHAIDAVIVTTILMEKKQLEMAGGVSYLTDLADSVPTTATFKHHEQILKEAYQLIGAKQAVSRFLNQPSEDRLDQLMDDLKKLKERIDLGEAGEKYV